MTGYWVKPRTTAQTNQFVAMFGISLRADGEPHEGQDDEGEAGLRVTVTVVVLMASFRRRVDGVGREPRATRRRYAVSDHFQPGRRVDRGLALLFGLGHASVVELAAHAALLASGPWLLACIVGGSGATRRRG